MGLPAVLLKRDTRANQPAATTVAAGTLFCVTDEDFVIEQSDGSAWNEYSTVVHNAAVFDLYDTVGVVDFAGSLVDVASQSLTLAMGDTVRFEIFGDIFNNTGGNRTFTVALNIASETIELTGAAVVATGTISVVSAVGYIMIANSTGFPRLQLTGRVNPATPDVTVTTDTTRTVWGFASSDHSGAQTVKIQVRSATAGAGAVYTAGYRITQLR